MEENIESENNLYLTDQTLEGLDFSPNWEHSSHLSSKKNKRLDNITKKTSSKLNKKNNNRVKKSKNVKIKKVKLEKTSFYPVNISILPNQKHLESLVRQVHQSRMAYPLIDLANLLISDNHACRVKIEVFDSHKDFYFFQSVYDDFISVSEKSMNDHLVNNHINIMYDIINEVQDPPTGNYAGIFRCKKTDTLIGPPNHHSYAKALDDWHRKYFDNYSLEKSKSFLEFVKNDEIIEAWKVRFSHTDRFRLKDNSNDELISRSKAEKKFILEAKKRRTKKVIIPLTSLSECNDDILISMVNRVLSKEKRFPLKFSHSMRAAFKHMKLYIFKIDKINYVTSINPKKLNEEDLAKEIEDIFNILKSNQGCSRNELVRLLAPKYEVDSEEARKLLQPLIWLIDRGHVIEYFNGKLALPI